MNGVYSLLPEGVSDPYALLEVSTDATLKHLRTAYKKRALKLHPDKNPEDKSAEKKFYSLTLAYEFLLDSKKRVSYDEWLNRQQETKKRYAKQDEVKRKFADSLSAREQAAEAVRTIPASSRTSVSESDFERAVRRENEELLRTCKIKRAGGDIKRTTLFQGPFVCPRPVKADRTAFEAFASTRVSQSQQNCVHVVNPTKTESCDSFEAETLTLLKLAAQRQALQRKVPDGGTCPPL